MTARPLPDRPEVALTKAGEESRTWLVWIDRQPIARVAPDPTGRWNAYLADGARTPYQAHRTRAAAARAAVEFHEGRHGEEDPS